MSETDDILDQLRPLMRLDWYGAHMERAKIALVAIDEIERLRAENARLHQSAGTEREACAKIADDAAETAYVMDGEDFRCLEIADAIRARGGK